MVGKRTFDTFTSPKNDHRKEDIESGPRQRRFNGLKDAVEYAIDRRTTTDLKKLLASGITRGEYERARKSDQEVSQKVKRHDLVAH